MEVKNRIIGIDLNREGSQICYYDRTEEDAVSIPVKEGSRQQIFSALMCMVPSEEAWYYGAEAEKYAENKEAVLVDRLYDLCAEGTSVRIGEKEYTDAELLALYLGQILAAAGVDSPSEQVACLMVTVPELTRCFVRAIRGAYEILGIPRNRGWLQDYRESFFVHTLYQRQDVWSRKTGMFEFRNGQVQFLDLEINFRTKPAAAYVSSRGSRVLKGSPEQKDQQLLAFAGDCLGEEFYSGIFLVGEEFSQSWAKESTRMLCRGQRKVFGGSNLFAKGAAFSAREKLEEKRMRGFLYVGRDLVRYNISMEMQVQGMMTNYPLIAAGANWYDTAAEAEVILDDLEELTFLVSRMNEKTRRKLVMPLPGLPKRPGKTTRLRIRLEYEAAGRCCIDAEDLGFGEMFPASGRVWHEVMEEQG